MCDWFYRAGALILLTSLLTVAAGCTGGSGAQLPGPRTAAAPTSPAAPPTAPAAAVHQVIIDNFTFSPPTLTIPAGAAVTWINRDDVPHTATSTAKPKQFDSGALDTDERYTHVFKEPGTYPYFCAVHPKMTGQIIVK